MSSSPKQDVQTVTPDGVSIERPIDGVRIRPLVTHTDDRGTVMEMYDPRWDWHPDPVVFTYMFTIRPGVVKGWGMHKRHEDRYCLLFGELEVVLYDDRPTSPTYKQLRKVYLSHVQRQLISIPSGVWHADHNIGHIDAVVVNFPTIQYDHSSPDKFRLPLDTDAIPYTFHGAKGW
jgi:dTDP-4-dehydrorhamnose 3,5-epimerase